MKRILIFLILASNMDAALTVTNRGTFVSSGSNTTIVYVPTTTIASGTLGVMLCVTPNQGSAGSNKIFTQSSFTDSVGNTWTRRLNALYDPGAAGAGIEIAAYTAPITTQVTASDNVTVTVSTNTGSKLAMVWEVSGNNGTPTYVTSAAVSDGLTSGQNGTAVSVTSSSITSGDAILAWNGGRDGTAVSTADTDTTNGSWSSGVTLNSTTVTRIYTQNKVTTGSGTQTWDITLGATVNWECGWIEIAEAVAATQSATNGFF